MVGNECDCVLCYVLLLHFGILASSFLACKMRGCKPRRMYKEINRQRRPMMMTTTGAREKIGMVNERRDKIRRNNPIWLLCIFPMCSSNLFFLFLLFCCCLFICWTYMHITYNDGGIISMNLILCSFRTKAASKRHKLKYLLKIFRAVFITCAWLGIGNCVFHLTRKKSHTKIAEKTAIPEARSVAPDTWNVFRTNDGSRFILQMIHTTENRWNIFRGATQRICDLGRHQFSHSFSLFDHLYLRCMFDRYYPDNNRKYLCESELGKASALAWFGWSYAQLVVAKKRPKLIDTLG